MRTFNRVLRIFTVITLFFFCWSYMPLYAAVAWAAEPPRKTGARNQKSGGKDQWPGFGSQGPGTTEKKLKDAKLPHRMVKGKERAPRLKQEKFERDFPQHRAKSKQKIAAEIPVEKA